MATSWRHSVLVVSSMSEISRPGPCRGGGREAGCRVHRGTSQPFPLRTAATTEKAAHCPKGRRALGTGWF